MKKLAILSAMMFAVALWFGSTVMAVDNPTFAEVNAGTTPPEPPNDSVCSTEFALNDRSDMVSVTATSDGSNIIVTVTTEGEFDDDDPDVPLKPMVKYRLHIDHKDPGDDAYDSDHSFIPDDEDTEDDCETSSDDGVKFRVHKNGTGKVYGPGDVDYTSAPDVLIFTVPYDGLSNNNTSGHVDPGNTVHLWMDTQYKQICDRVPDTSVESEDPECAKPEIPDEVLTIKLDVPQQLDFVGVIIKFI